MSAVAGRIANRTDRVRGYRIFWLVAVVMTLVAASGCATSSSSSRTGVRDSDAYLTYEDLPADIGRGFPEARVPRGAAISPEKGNSSPDFSMVFEDGRELALSDLRGRPVMLNFWATWCPPCRAEMPDIVNETVGDEDVVVLAVNVQEDLDAVRAFAEEFNMHMPVVRDTDGRLRDLYEVRGMPTSVFISRDGSVASMWAGMLDGKTLGAQLDGIR